MATTICELVKVDVTDEDGHGISVTLPAYTVSADTLNERVPRLLGEYIALSETNETGMSLADFALRLIAVASGDPREIGADND